MEFELSELASMIWIILALVGFVILAILWVAGKMSTAMAESTRTLALTERVVELLESIDQKLGDDR